MTGRDPQPLAEMLGASFGGYMDDTSSVLTTIHVREIGKDGVARQHSRLPMLIPVDLLRQIRSSMHGLRQAMAQAGADRDDLPPPEAPLPAWDEEPQWVQGAPAAWCEGLRFALLESGTTTATFTLVEAGRVVRGVHGNYLEPALAPGKRTHEKYLFSYRAVSALEAAIGRILVMVAPWEESLPMVVEATVTDHFPDLCAARVAGRTGVEH